MHLIKLCGHEACHFSAIFKTTRVPERKPRGKFTNSSSLVFLIPKEIYFYRIVCGNQINQIMSNAYVCRHRFIRIIRNTKRSVHDIL